MPRQVQIPSNSAGPFVLRDLTPRLPSLYPALCALLAAFAFAFNWATGHRGVFLFDQSLMIDGGWRVLHGQVPYKDFLMPFPPLSFYIQAFFFKLLGVNWTATVVPACLMSTLGALSVARSVRLLSGGSKVLGLCAGLTAAVSIQAPFGTFLFDQAAVFFNLIAFQAAVESLHASAWRRRAWQFAAGVASGLAVLNKQNFGFLFLPVVLAVLFAGELGGLRKAARAILAAVAGFALTLVLLLGWVALYSDLRLFYRSTVEVAGDIGRSRLTLGLIGRAVRFEGTPYFFQVDLLGPVAVLALLAVAVWRRLAQNPAQLNWRPVAPAIAAAFLLPFYRSFSWIVTLNEWENNFATVGLAACLGASLLLWGFGCVQVRPLFQRGGFGAMSRANLLKLGLLAAIGLWSAMTFAYITKVAWTRTVQQFRKGARFEHPVRVPGMERVRWGEPSHINDHTTVDRDDFEALAGYLAERGRNFFIMGDSILLYGLLRVPPPQPVFYFETSHCYREQDIPELDEWILASLIRNEVEVVVREKETFMPKVRDAYPKFTRTWSWFVSEFDKKAEFGLFEIWERKQGGRD